MYEYDAYADARKEFPRLREPLQTAEGEWFFVKNDLLAGTMYFSSSKETMSNLAAVRVERVKEILAQNRAGKKPESLLEAGEIVPAAEEPTYRAEEDSITRFDSAKRRSRRNRSRGGKGQGAGRSGDDNAARSTSAPQKEARGEAGRPQRNPKPQEQPIPAKEGAARTEERRQSRDAANGERPENGARRNGRNRGRGRGNGNGNVPQREGAEHATESRENGRLAAADTERTERRNGNNRRRRDNNAPKEGNGRRANGNENRTAANENRTADSNGRE